MSRFASRENSRAEQHTIHRELESLLGAVEVTGLSGWERTKKLYGTGLAEGADSVAQAPRAGRPIEPAPPSASPIQDPLFEEAA